MMLLLLLLMGTSRAQAPVEAPVPRPEPLLGMNLGGGLSSYIISSHLQTGWARYLETVPATRLLHGMGSWTACSEVQKPEDAERILGPLHDYGLGIFRHAVNWGETVYRTDPNEPLRLSAPADARCRAILRAAKRHGFRLILLLNAHQGVPCALRGTEGRFLADAPEGATEVLLAIQDASILRLGYSGISGVAGYCAAEALFRSVQPEPALGERAYRVTLVRPLARAHVRDAAVGVDTLQYRPFGDPASDPETYQGWAAYADLLARTVAEEGLPDGQVSFEVWNEQTFGTLFLHISEYDPALKGGFDPNRMLQLAANAVRRYFPQKSGVINGFSNTSCFFEGFWGGTRPAGVDGESYHPYGNTWRGFPALAQEKNRRHLLEAFRNVDGFVPTYGILFPEYCANYVMSHSLVTLLQPEMRDLLVRNGRAPVGWQCGMTEEGVFLNEVNLPEPFATRARERPEHYVGKYWLRLYPFFLNKGMSFVCDGSLRNPGDWKTGWERRFIETGDLSYLQSLLPVQRLARVFEGAVAVPQERLFRLRPRVWQLSGQDKVIFDTQGAAMVTQVPAGEEGRPWDPSRLRPRPLTYRDVFCLLPFQVDDDTLALGAYIQTRNLFDDVPDAGRYRLTFPELRFDPRNVSVRDPLADRAVPAEVATIAGATSITLTLTDYPVWIVLRSVNGPRGGGAVTATAG